MAQDPPAPSSTRSASSSSSTRSHRGGFSSAAGFILAAAGSAVGLGNLWKFPYIAGENGGGAFVLVYLIAIALVGVPLMLAEVSAGRRTRRAVAGALNELTATRGAGARAAGRATGWLAILTSFATLAFYAVAAGWGIHLLALSVLPGTEWGSADTYSIVSGSTVLSATWGTVFLLLVVGVIAAGVQSGIERLCRVLMPVLFALQIGLLAYVASGGGMDEALTFLFAPDWSELSAHGVLVALGHAFFSLSLGMGAMVTYGSYAEGEGNVLRDSLAIVALDTIVALLAATLIFGALFQQGGEPAAGPGLLYQTLPPLFEQMPAGRLVAVAFFVLVFLAAWSSGVGLFEVVVAGLVEQRGISRRRAAISAGLAVWGVSIPCAASSSFFGFLDGSTSHVLLPLGGLAFALLAGWTFPRDTHDLPFSAEGTGSLVLTLGLRWWCPAVIAAVLLTELGVI